ncbi:MAG: 50S ribosome-binding GTPase [Candidatus Lokiarchaeota archaeon]|nr:50S ribosome-binding GTPase [Candidatus Lokiarchaeota archaeon]
MKILIFGPQNAGKTSLMRTTCLGYNFMKVINLKPTKGVSRENFIFRGIMELNIWDAGGQERYMERYFSESQRELIFSEITTAIFMVDTAAPEANVKDIFDKFHTYVWEFSPHVDKIYVLLNKIDLDNSREDDYYEILSKDLEKEIKEKIVFTPVSVKEGSAQHRLIEILDYEIQKNTLSMQRLGKIRHLLNELKSESLSEYMLFNQPDGLLIASTIGKFDSKPLQFMKLEMGTLDSNLYQIYSKVMLLVNTNPSPLSLSTIVYESDDSYVLIKQLEDVGVIMAVTKNKKPEVFNGVMNALNGEELKNLEDFLRSSI